MLACLSFVSAPRSVAEPPAVAVVDSRALNSGILSLPTAQDGLKAQMATAVTALKSQVERQWGQGEVRVSDTTTYVKYTRGYESRVITDFKEGLLAVETIDQAGPRGSLETAIVDALLTTDDPSNVDLFTDKAVRIDAGRHPYLYGLVLDERGVAVGTSAQAKRFARYLISSKMQTRTITGEKGAQSSHLVTLPLVKDFELKAASRYRANILESAAKWHVSATLVLAIMRTESRFNPFAVSSAPAYGLMQLVPSGSNRAIYKAVSGIDAIPTAIYLSDPAHSIDFGAAYLSSLNTGYFSTIQDQASRDLCLIAAYKTGMRRVTQTFDSDSRAAMAAINTLTPDGVYEKLRTALPSAEARQYVVMVTEYRRHLGAGL